MLEKLFLRSVPCHPTIAGNDDPLPFGVQFPDPLNVFDPRTKAFPKVNNIMPPDKQSRKGFCECGRKILVHHHFQAAINSP